MKKILTTLLLCIMAITCTVCAFACGGTQSEKCDSGEHTYGELIEVKPTCTEKGYTLHKCVKCGYTYKDNYINATGHNFIESKCKECGKTLSDGLTYTSIRSGYELSKIGTCKDTDIIIPDTYNGEPVLSIGYGAFYNCSSLTSIEIPNSVTSIGDNAFNNCSSLKRVVMGNSVQSIGDSAFYGCSKLTSVEIPNSVISIGDSAFYGCYKLVEVINLSGIIITEGSKDEDYAGYYALNVKTSGVSEIVNKDGYLFYTVGKKNYLFGYTGSEKDLVLPDNYNGQSYEIYDYAFRSCSSLTSVKIPNCVTSIGEEAFAFCSSLKSIEIPDSVESIRIYAFEDCESLTSVVIGNGVTSIENLVFVGCSSLKSIVFNDTTTWYMVDGSYELENWKNKTGGTETSVTNSSANATNFTSGYRKYYWYKK